MYIFTKVSYFVKLIIINISLTLLPSLSSQHCTYMILQKKGLQLNDNAKICWFCRETEHKIRRPEWRPAALGYTGFATRRAKSTEFLKDTNIILSFSTKHHFWKTQRLLYFILHMIIFKLKDTTIALFIAILQPIISGRHSDCFTLYLILYLTIAHYLIYTKHISPSCQSRTQ